MNHKYLEGFISSVCGVCGFQVADINIHIPDTLLKFSTAMLTALCAGAMGWLGQQLIKKIYYFIKSKIKNNGN